MATLDLHPQEVTGVVVDRGTIVTLGTTEFDADGEYRTDENWEEHITTWRPATGSDALS